MRKRKIETSKAILYLTDGLVILIVVASIILSFITQDATPLEWISAGVFALATTSHGFYFWKAKCENLHKFGLDDRIDNNDIM